MNRSMTSLKLLPCGHSIGLNFLQQEFTVEDFIPVLKDNGLYYFPARDAGIKVGDVIVQVAGKKIRNEREMCKTINKAAEKGPVELTVRRQDKTFSLSINPFYYTKTKSFKLGIKLRAFTSGLGTLTFYEPTTKWFGALGHLATECSEGLAANTMFPSTVASIKKGKPYRPGKKLGFLNKKNDFFGTIMYNNQSGIFGTLNGKIESPYFREPISVAEKSQIRPGYASLYTVINSGIIEEFAVKIEAIELDNQGNKDLRITIEDERLEKRTGGIILGMSGSPIVQDGKLIAALSHLSFYNSLNGYAVSIENMLQESLVAAIATRP